MQDHRRHKSYSRNSPVTGLGQAVLTPAKRDRAILLIHCGVVSEKYRAELRELAEKVCSDGRFAVVVAQNRDEQFRLATPLAPRPASDPLDPRGAPGSGHALGDEADSARGGQGEGEDPARGMVLLTPPRRQIGRASCRERVWSSVRAASGRK